jgi:hypothetical protein
MAIYGINFNGKSIPDGAAFRKFPKRIKLPGMGRGEYAELKGIGQSEIEKNAMLIQANNGHRNLHVEVRQTAGGLWYGIYVS